MGILEHSIGRRNFLRLAATTGLATAAGSLAGCKADGRPNPASEGGETATVCANDRAVIEGKGEWVISHCWAEADCGGACLNRQYVVDGVVIRADTDNERDDTEEAPQWRACPRGRSKRQNVYGIGRLKYPIKRKNWQPGGKDFHGELRGKDEWERISWDEAIDLVGTEIKRIYDDYGPNAALVCSYYKVPIFFQTLGGFTSFDDAVSYGTYTPYCLTLDMGYYGEPGVPGMNDRTDIKNADYIIMTSGNPSWAATGNPMYYFQLARDNGTQYAYVGPSYNVSAAALDAKWIPVRNGTDTAFWLAVAYEMLQMDDQIGNIVDWDFLNKYCVGFDLDHLPDDATIRECFKDYVLGSYDDEPKTAEWATEICGASVDDIRWIADKMGKQYNTMLIHSYAAFRCNGAENLPQLIMTVACMGGHVGKKGNCFGAGLYAQFSANAGEQMILCGPTNYASVANGANYVGGDMIPCQVGWRALLDGKYTCYGDGILGGDFSTFHGPVTRDCDVRMIYVQGQNPLHTKGHGQVDGVAAFRKVEFVCVQDIFCSDSAMYADIVLPVITPWEGDLNPESGDPIWPTQTVLWDGLTAEDTITGETNRDLFLSIKPIIKPLFDARSDVWIMRHLCEKVGIDPNELYPVSEVQEWFDRLYGATYLDDDGVYKPLFNVSQKVIDEYGVDNTPKNDGIIDIEDFWKKGFFSIDRKEGDGRGFIKFKDFVDDPEGHPLASKSGKFEIYCQTKADALNQCELADEPIKPYANYFTPTTGYVTSFKNWETKEPGDYPYMMSQPHYLRRAHTQNDDSTWLREVLENPIFINRSDAEAKGIETGDTVRVFNQFGQVLRQASVLSSIMPGCVALPHGAHMDLDETDPDNPIDLAGSENVLMGYDPSNYMFALSGYNTTLVNFEKWSGKPIPRDCEREYAHIEFSEA